MYVPQPLRLDGVTLPAGLGELVERLALNAHEEWARQRLAEGWVFGPTRDDRARTHPCLVPYQQLPEAEKAYDRLMVEATLKAVVKLGYVISKVRSSGSPTD